MSTSSPELVVETLNRYLLLDAPNVNFLDSIDLRHDDVERKPVAVVLTATFQHAQHRVHLHLVHTTQENGVHWHISDVDATHAQLPVAELRASIARSHTLHHPLFRSLENAIATLRTTLHTDPSNRAHRAPHTTPQPHLAIQAALPSPALPQYHPSLLCADLCLTLLHAALASARSTALVNPVPACFVGGGGGEEEGARLLERGDRLDGRADAKFVNAQLPAIEAAFAHLPKLTRIDFAATAGGVVDSRSNQQPLHSLPLDAQQLLACLLSSHVRFRSVRPNPNLYTLGHTAAHRHAAATASATTLTPPTYQFDLTPLPHPHFTAQAARHTSRLVFHGSPLQNWHSIVRRGLEVKSGTREATSGALFGKGVYFSDDLRVARMFSGVQAAWGQSLLGDRLEVVGLYELVMDPEGVRMGEEVVKVKPKADGGWLAGGDDQSEEVPENYYVVADNSYFVLRSLLVWRVMDKKPASVLRSSWMMIVGYVVLLLVIVMSQVDWKYVRNVAVRYIR